MTGPTIHPTAIVHAAAHIHDTCEIGPYCTVAASVTMGRNNRLISHVVIQNRTTIGDGNVIHPFAVIGGIPQDMKYRGEESALVIGDNNTIREAVTINLGTEGGGGTTRIGKCNLLMAYVHVAHDCSVGDNVVIGNCCQIAGHVRIEDWAVIGGLTGVSQRVRIGAHSYIGGCSGIDRDVAPFTLGRGPTGGFVISGMNLVGLKRRGFNREELAALQAVSRLFFKDKMLEKNDVLNQLERGWGSIEVVQQFIRFVRTSAKGVFR